ncbi:MAG: AraC family transcriptional regulator [Ruminococcaceae bacterium]|nr:AraC family transcriptional regulator [Oscillospiraceae bacterium]
MEYEHYRDAKEFFCIGKNYCKEHFHRAIEIQYCIKENKELLIDGKNETLSEGEFLFIPPFCTHRFPRQENHSSLAVVFPVSYTDTWEQALKDKQLSHLIFKDKTLAKDLYDHLIQLASTKNPILRDGIYKYVLGKLLEHGKFQAKTQNSKGDFALQTLTYLEKHYAEPLTLSKVANELGYNYSYFSSIFKKTFRAGFCEYLAMLRVRKSLPLLRSEKIEDVAYKVGFGSIQSYYLCFKRVMKTSPAAYRQK